jgi:hypothetical protein
LLGRRWVFQKWTPQLHTASRKEHIAGVGKPQRASFGFLAFAEKYDISLDWLVHGEGFNLGRHLTVSSNGKLAILPIMSAERKAVQS